jgi:methyltransferase-like protein 6
MSYFFSKEDLAARAQAAGLEAVEAEYVCVFNTNRKTGQQLRRVFVHGVFRKPAAGDEGPGC